MYAYIRLYQNHGQGSILDITTLGFGTPSPQTLIDRWKLPLTGSFAVTLSALVANSPQVSFSSLDLTLNHVVTRMRLSTEWIRYSTSRKGLRVSNECKGSQRATYFLQLTYRTSIPLLAVSVVLQWLLSQSIFLSNIEIFHKRRTTTSDIPDTQR